MKPKATFKRKTLAIKSKPIPNLIPGRYVLKRPAKTSAATV